MGNCSSFERPVVIFLSAHAYISQTATVLGAPSILFREDLPQSGLILSNCVLTGACLDQHFVPETLLERDQELLLLR